MLRVSNIHKATCRGHDYEVPATRAWRMLQCSVRSGRAQRRLWAHDSYLILAGTDRPRSWLHHWRSSSCLTFTDTSKAYLRWGTRREAAPRVGRDHATRSTPRPPATASERSESYSSLFLSPRQLANVLSHRKPNPFSARRGHGRAGEAMGAGNNEQRWTTSTGREPNGGKLMDDSHSHEHDIRYPRSWRSCKAKSGHAHKGTFRFLIQVFPGIISFLLSLLNIKQE